MAINKNHEFEDLDGVKCAIVEKNVSPERVAFLKKILEYNGYAVITVPSPPPKAAAKPAAAAPLAEGTPAPTPVEPPPPASTFTLGVTDVMFNVTNAIFGRSLRTPGGHIVTVAYWEQQEKEPHDEIPYYEFNPGTASQ